MTETPIDRDITRMWEHMRETREIASQARAEAEKGRADLRAHDATCTERHISLSRGQEEIRGIMDQQHEANRTVQKIMISLTFLVLLVELGKATVPEVWRLLMEIH